MFHYELAGSIKRIQHGIPCCYVGIHVERAGWGDAAVKVGSGRATRGVVETERLDGLQPALWRIGDGKY